MGCASSTGRAAALNEAAVPGRAAAPQLVAAVGQAQQTHKRAVALQEQRSAHAPGAAEAAEADQPAAVAGEPRRVEALAAAPEAQAAAGEAEKEPGLCDPVFGDYGIYLFLGLFSCCDAPKPQPVEPVPAEPQPVGPVPAEPQPMGPVQVESMALPAKVGGAGAKSHH